jgi:hypothetical protein
MRKSEEIENIQTGQKSKNSRHSSLYSRDMNPVSLEKSEK